MLNCHTHPTDPIRDKKTNAFDTSVASPSRQHNFTVRVSHRCIVTVAEFGRSRQRRRWNPLYGFPSLCAPAIEFGRSRRIWALLDGDDLYLYAYACWVVSIIRHSGVFAQPRARTRAWFSRNGLGHNWGGVLWHISTLLGITEWGLGVYSWCMTSCALVRLFGARRSLGWVAGTLN